MREEIEAAGWCARWFGPRAGVDGVTATVRPDAILIAPTTVEDAVELRVATGQDRVVPCLLLTGPPSELDVARQLAEYGIATLPPPEEDAGLVEILSALAAWLGEGSRTVPLRLTATLTCGDRAYPGQVVRGGDETAELSLAPVGLPRGAGSVALGGGGEPRAVAPVEVLTAEAAVGGPDGPELRVVVRLVEVPEPWPSWVRVDGRPASAPDAPAPSLPVDAALAQVVAVARGEEAGATLAGPLTPIRIRECLEAGPPGLPGLLAEGTEVEADREYHRDVASLAALWLLCDQMLLRVPGEGIPELAGKISDLLGSAQRTFREIDGRRERDISASSLGRELYVDLRARFLAVAIDLRDRWAEYDPDRARRSLAGLKTAAEYTPGALARGEVEALRRLLATRRPPALETASWVRSRGAARREAVRRFGERVARRLASRGVSAALFGVVAAWLAWGMFDETRRPPPEDLPVGTLAAMSNGLMEAQRSAGGRGDLVIATVNPVFWTMLAQSERAEEANALRRRLGDQGVRLAYLYDPEGHLLAILDGESVTLVNRYAAEGR
ncbi:hypothetical protein L6R50_08135 [Myxococcota bacterium]|nr:hypothetical protein [Myxococcota bacterium]